MMFKHRHRLIESMDCKTLLMFNLSVLIICNNSNKSLIAIMDKHCELIQADVCPCLRITGKNNNSSSYINESYYNDINNSSYINAFNVESYYNDFKFQSNELYPLWRSL
ncbi:hypothetical protein ACTFIR_007927 [Dictyostelium discoideum]